MFGRHASAAARTEKERNKLKEIQAKKTIERRDTKRALKTDKVARMFEQAETRNAGLVTSFHLLFNCKLSTENIRAHFNVLFESTNPWFLDDPLLDNLSDFIY